MLYNQPLDKPSDPNAPYVDGNPNAGIQGSIVPAASVEFDQREVVEVITRANARGYSDFSGTPCAAPGNFDLTQLRKAIEGFITGWSFIIDTTITFKVHGAGYDFVDLNAAMQYLRKYYITTRGHVILQLAGAATGATTAVQYTYSVPIYFLHPNNNRISVYGAPMLAPMPPNASGYASNGSAPATRAADTNTNLTMLRTKFATELHCVTGAGVVIANAPNLMHFDGVLLTGDGSGAGGIAFTASYGFMNTDSAMGVAVVGFGSTGIGLELCATVGTAGPGAFVNETASCNLVVIGNAGSGMGLADGSYFTMAGNVTALSNGGPGFLVWPRGGVQMDGAVDAQSNADCGVKCLLTSTVYISGPISAGAAYRASQIWKNASWGFWAHHCWADANINCSGNTGGSVFADCGSQVNAFGGDQGISGSCSPPWNTVGNSNAMIT